MKLVKPRVNTEIQRNPEDWEDVQSPLRLSLPLPFSVASCQVPGKPNELPQCCRAVFYTEVAVGRQERG